MTNQMVLETLLLARKRIKDRFLAFSFVDWTQCTCGHIYAASGGRRAESSIAVVSPSHDTRYGEVIETVARALGWDGLDPLHDTASEVDPLHDTASEAAVVYVSFATREMPDLEERGVKRSDALAVLDRAIATIEAWEEADRLRVLEQAREVVDAVEPERVLVS